MQVAALIGAFMSLGACSPSWYHLAMRNNVAENVRVEVKAQKNDGQPVLIAEGPIGAGQSYKMSGQADHDAKVHVEARIQGDDQSPPAVREIFVGETAIVFNVNPESAKDKNKPKLKIDRPR